MRIWIDPGPGRGRANLTVDEIVDALRGQNVQVAGRRRRPAAVQPRPAAFELNIQTQGRLSDPDEFADIIIKRDARGPR